MFTHVNAGEELGRSGWQVGRLGISCGYILTANGNIYEMPNTIEECFDRNSYQDGFQKHLSCWIYQRIMRGSGSPCQNL